MSEPRLPVRRFIAEGVVIVVSILLAFGVDAWWDGFQESRRRSALVAGLVSDFDATRDRLSSAAASGDSIIQRISDYFSLRGSPELPSLDSTQFLAHALALPPPEYAPILGNYDAALQSGEMALLDNVGFYQGSSPVRVSCGGQQRAACTAYFWVG